MSPVSRRHFLIALSASAPAARLLAQEGNDDVILRAMRDDSRHKRLIARLRSG